MLKVHIYRGTLKERTLNSKRATLDIAYSKQNALSDYMLALTQADYGERQPNALKNYPRWSSSIWDLTARALTRVLYDRDQAPHADVPDKRCAFATRLCACVERTIATDRGVELATVEISQRGNKRGYYTANFEEDILGSRTATFAYGHKFLDPCDLLLRAICWAFYGQDTLGPMPALVLPPTMTLDGVERFHFEALAEPARTGFFRFMRGSKPDPFEMEPLPLATDYVSFLMKA